MAAAARLIVLGRQGAGKGTQCSMLAAHLEIPHISTGDLLRAEATDGTDLGKAAHAAMEQGLLVPDELVLDVLAKRLAGPDARRRGYLLDGFPRTLSQAQALFEVLGSGAADLAIEIHVSTSGVLPRLAARRVCADCGTTTTLCPEGTADRPCDECGGDLVQRADDTEAAIRRRLAIYDEQSTPLLTWLESQGLLVSVDGTGSPEAVHERVMAAVRTRVPTVDPARAEGLVAG
jgi:adenylate kinase